MSDDFIQDFKNEILENIPTNPAWAEDISICLLSTFCGNVNTSTKMGKIKANIQYIAIADSSAIKSLPLREYLHPTLDKVRELSGNLDLNFKLPSSFTPESMTLWFSGGTLGKKEIESHQHQGIIIRDEISRMFKETTGKGYNVQLQEFMSEMFDGYIDGRFTISHGESKVVKDCYVSFIGATTPYLYNVLEQEIFIQGLGSRILWETFRTEHRDYKEEEIIVNNVKNIRKEEFITKYAKILTKISQFKSININVGSPEISTSFVNIRNKYDRKALEFNLKDKNSLEALYISKAFVKLWKLASLHVVSRNCYNFINQNKDSEIVLEFNQDDINWAEERIDGHINKFIYMLNEWRTKPVFKPIESDKYSQDAVLSALRNSADLILTRRELEETTNLYSRKLADILRSVINANYVKMLKKSEVLALGEEFFNKHGINPQKMMPQCYKLIE
jgi:hypothetical protein